MNTQEEAVERYLRWCADATAAPTDLDVLQLWDYEHAAGERARSALTAWAREHSVFSHISPGISPHENITAHHRP